MSLLRLGLEQTDWGERSTTACLSAGHLLDETGDTRLGEQEDGGGGGQTNSSSPQFVSSRFLAQA